MEAIDIYDTNRNKQGYIKYRGRDNLDSGEFMIGVGALIINSKGEVLISKRTMNKDRYPGYWEVNGGAVTHGEESGPAIIREIKEELGIDLKIEDGFLLKTTKNDYKFADLWAFKVDAQIEDLVFAENEVETAEWVNFDRIVELKKQGVFVDSNNITREDYEKAKEMLGCDI